MSDLNYPQILEEEVIKATENRKPHISRDIITAKLILKECSGDTGDCLYDHLSDIIKRVVDEKPSNVVDYFEQYSQQIKEDKFRMNENLLEDTYVEPERLETAKKLFNSLIKVPASPDFPGATVDDLETLEEKKYSFLTDFMHLQFYWNFAGIGFPQDEVYLLALSMKKLEEKEFISDIRFWGHFYGLRKNYYVVEADLTIAGIANKIQQKETESQINEIVDSFINLQSDSKITHQDMRLSDYRLETVPLPMTVRPKVFEIKSEEIGSGLNSQIYFVCNQVGDEWSELPSVTPQQIIVSRQIRKFLTGNLNKEIISVPNFPGKEKHYLRSLIARITAGTFVSPIDYYQFESNTEEKVDEESNNEEEEEEEIEIVPKDLNNLRKNSSYNPNTTKDLLNLASWVHNKPFISNQGKTTAFIPDEHLEVKSLNEDNQEEEEEEIKSNSSIDSKLKQIFVESKIETGKALLSPCSNDQCSEDIPPWTTRLTSIGNEKNGMVLLRSNLWPGSFTISSGKIMSNIYIGWGHKFSSRDYAPPALPPMQNEFSSDPELSVFQDPTVEQEEELRLMKERKQMELEDEHDFVDSEDDENDNENEEEES